MRVLGIRFCSVSPQAREFAEFLDALGLPRQPFPEMEGVAEDAFLGAVFPADSSAGSTWIELWEPAEGMHEGVMLQIVVDDADAFAERARAHGLDPRGPMDAHGERIYYLKAPTGLPVTFQSVAPPAG